MVKLYRDEDTSEIRFEGNAMLVMAEAMSLLDRFTERLELQDPALTKVFRKTIIAWAKGEIDD